MNLGKNMMLDTADNKIYFPRFYDIDTICSYDNSGQLKFDVDIEMEQGYWNTSSSRLWTRIRDLMHNDIVTTYNNMRQNGVSYENMMKYIYDEQIAKIPQTYYNKDYDVKYAPFADSYIGMAHGDTYEHVKRWLKQRFTFVDTLFDYAPSYNNDILTIRANTTELMTLEIETYTPVYLHLSWYNGQMDKKKIDGKVSVEFSGKAQTATDQEVLIYGGSNVKSIKGIQSANPNRLILGSATKLTELDASNCPLLYEINMNKANLSPHEYLNKVNLSNCPLLEGNLRLNNSPLVQEINIKGTNITGMNLPSSIRNLQTLRLPNTMTELTLNDAGMLHTLEFDEGINLQSVSMTNCNALENVIGLDLLQTPSIMLNNSYNTVAELYFRDTTNLSLSNMSNLERVIFTPNNEYETFELINVANAPNYKVTTFNCPKLSTFMTTAPYRESFNNCGMRDKIIQVEEYEIEYLTQDYTPNNQSFSFTIDSIDFNNQSIMAEIDLTECTSANENILSFGNAINQWSNSSALHIYYTQSSATLRVSYVGQTLRDVVIEDVSKVKVTFGIQGLSINDGDYILNSTITNNILVQNSLSVGSTEGQTRSKATYKYIGYDGIEIVDHVIQVKDYGNIQPNTTFTANSIDISNTQFTDVKLLCTTDTNTLKLPTTVKNFYCDSSFDLDTNFLEDGEYDVVHGELVEPYTTDYEGEVNRFSNNEASLLMKDICTIPTSYINGVTGDAVYHKSYSLSDFIEVVSGTRITLNFWYCDVSEYNADKWYIKQTRLYNNGTQKLILDSNCKYIRVNAEPNYLDDINVITCTPLVTYIPNLIPSSADGSLIFSMYAPSNTVAPASGTWDLKGLEFDNFHTFGMNNDVKPEYILGYTQNKDLVLLEKFNYNYTTIHGGNVGTGYATPYIKVNVGDTISLTTSDSSTVGCYYSTDYDELTGKATSQSWDGINRASGFAYTIKNASQCLRAFSIYNSVEWFDLTINNITVRYTIADMPKITDGNDAKFKEYYEPFETIYTVNSITMPARYVDYNITIKNANIAPKTHNTMLYPLLVNEDNPIEGKLDYTNYTGNNLSWSFAYVNMNKVNIVQPKDELLNTYEYRYNAFYETEYEFDDPNEVLRYITSSSNLLPTFNEGFTYTYDKLDNNDGTYIYRIYANDPTLLTSFELEKVPYLRITNAENLLSPIDLTKYETVSISESYYDITELYFSEATNLTLTNMPYLERVIYLPNDEYEVFEIINVVNSKDYIITTSECPRLTTFMTTASHRESYNNEDVIAEVITEITNTDNELFTNEYVFSKTYWEEDGTEIQGSVNLLHYEIPSIEDSVKAIHMVQGLDSTNRVTFFNDDKFISCEVITTACELDFKLHRNCNRIVFICEREGIVSSVVESILTTTLVKEYGSVEPNIIFNANTLDISNTQFTDVKLLCTTDLNVLKLPTTVRNFYCDSSFDLDTDYLTDGDYDVVHSEFVEPYTTDYEGEIKVDKGVNILNIVENGSLGAINTTTGVFESSTLFYSTDYINVEANSFICFEVPTKRGSTYHGVVAYDVNKTYISGIYKGGGSDSVVAKQTLVLPNGTVYIRAYSNNDTAYIEYNAMGAPNLIPSSSDGSLIFSMYAPNNTVAPASRTWDLKGLEFDNFHTFGMNNDVKQDSEGNITMPARYDDYNITIKNANIAPKTHNTMLYPLLVNEDNPIEGKLDYTDYNGEYLSWSFAYTNTNKVNIIQPKDELLNSYGYRYNAFYRTEYEFDNPNEVMEYTTTSSNLLPIFNEGFTYAYDKIDNDDGTYTYKIYANDISLLTSFELEKVPYLRIVNAENLVSPIDLTKYEVVEIDNSYSNITELYFRDSTNLTLSNMSNLERVIYLPNDEYEVFELINVANAPDYKITTFNCPKLSTFMTTAPYRESFNNVSGYVDKEVSVINWSEFNGNVSVLTDTVLRPNTGLVESLSGNIATESFIHVKEGESYTVASDGGWLNVVGYDENEVYKKTISPGTNIKTYTFTADCFYIKVGSNGGSYITMQGLVGEESIEIIQIKDYGNIQPNTTFTANSIDISNTQFTDVKLLCTTDTNTLKLPTTVKNFYCDSSFDLDTDYLEDGEYDVVHGELVEQYTTDSKGEVQIIESKEKNTPLPNLTWTHTDYALSGDGELYNSSGCKITDFIEVTPSTTVSMTNGEGTSYNFQCICYYDENKNYLYGENWIATVSLPSNAHYIRFSHRTVIATDSSYTVVYSQPVIYTPNLVPSSADGSLIFSMYAPSNTVAPASGTWDLKGLKFDNFHTFGMNNDVKGGYNNYLLIDTLLTGDKFNTTETVNFTEGEYIEVSVDLSGHTINELENVIAFGLGDINTWGSDHKVYVYYNGSNKESIMQLCKNNNVSSIRPIVNGTNLTIRFDKNGIWYNGTLATGFDQFMNEWVSWFDNQKINIWITNDSPTGNIHYNYIMVKHKDIYSLTMPSRYDDYNITIKNAHISPKTHNTMLYPLLVNEDNPITGTLDYTNYAGKHLSWSFAYTDEEYVDIIQPKDELINSYKYKYNTYYDTEYEFDSPYEIARYTSSASGVLPSFNKEFTYTYDEIDNGDGTYTTKIYADSLDNLPTSISFSGKSALLTVDKLNTSNVDGFRWMFNNCTSLTSMNAELDTNKVTDVYGMFTNCYSLTNLNSRNWIMPNITTTQEMFYNCGELTTLDLSSLIGGNVTTTYRMFYGCNKLTSLDVSGFDTSKVTDMSYMFFSCGVLSLDVKDWNVEKVTNMHGIFSYMPNITSIDINGWVTTSLVSATEMFHGSEKLTTVDATGLTFADNSNIDRMFYNCYGLTEVIGIETWDVSKVTHMNSVFRMNKANKLTSLDVSSWDTSQVTIMDGMFRGCSGLTALDVSGFDTKNVTTMISMFQDCSSLTSLDVSGFDTSKVTNISEMFNGCQKLTEITGLENWDTGQITIMSSTFNQCYELESLQGIENWNVEKLNSLYFAFRYCKKITSLDLSNWNITSALNNIGYTFMLCESLEYLDLSNWDVSNVTAYSGCFSFGTPNKIKRVSLNGWTKDKIELVIPILPTKTETSTVQGSVIIDESILPSGWVYDNVLEVAIYTCSTSGVLPTFNTEFTYTHAEVDNGDGTYTTKVAADSLDNLPTSISFREKSALLTVDKLNTSNVTNMSFMFCRCRSLTALDVSGFDTSNVTAMNNMFQECIALTALDVSGFDTSNVTVMASMFYGCQLLSALDVSGFDTGKVTNMYYMFAECNSLTSLDVSGFVTSEVTNMSSMFQNCHSLTSLDVSGFDTKNVTDMSKMFPGCNSLTSLDLRGFVTSEVTNMSSMFHSCSGLTSLDVSNFDTSKVTTMSEMFSGCNVLSIEGLGNWDVKNVTDMSNMFLHCRGITSLLEISDWDTSSLKSLCRTFMGCAELIELDVSNWNASKFETLLETFYDCAKIISFNLGNWDCRRVVSISGMFQGCSSLSSVILPKEVGKGCNAFSAFRNCTNLKEVTLPKGIGNISHMLNNCYNLEKAVIPLDDITDVQDTTFNNCRALVNIDWVGDLSNNFNIINKPGEHVTTESDVHELMTNLGDLKKDKIKISLSKGTIKVNDTEKTIE